MSDEHPYSSPPLADPTMPPASDPSIAGAPPPEGKAVRFPDAREPDRVRSAMSWGLTILVALAVTFGVKTWLIQVYSIPSTSMVPTLLVGDRVVVSKLNRNPGRGDIIVFDRPANDPGGPNDPKVLIKRVIGLPGDTVSAKDGKVLVNGTVLREDYLPDGVTTEMTHPVKVAEGQLLVFGDNRPSSQDGRYFGTISKKLIVGRALLRVWPLSRVGRL